MSDVVEDKSMILKHVRTPEYNYTMNRFTGNNARWGKTRDDDPPYSYIGPELLDIEISTICHGINGVPCKHCYKGNNGHGYNMTLDVFKQIFNKLPGNVSQIAFGIGDLDSNPDMLDIFKYCLENPYNRVTPNFTTNGWGLTDELAAQLVSICGSIAVSRYSKKDVCYNAIAKLTSLGFKQANIHMLVSEETLDQCYETIEDIKTDPRLKYLNAIVMLTLKPKGERNTYTKLSKEKYDKLIEDMMTLSKERHVKVGFDSCAAPNFLKAVKDDSNIKSLTEQTESCESTLFSLYINVFGWVFPCSFMEGERGWPNLNYTHCISMLDNCEDFIQDIWFHERIKEFRKSLLCQADNCKTCPYFNV